MSETGTALSVALGATLLAMVTWWGWTAWNGEAKPPVLHAGAPAYLAVPPR